MTEVPKQKKSAPARIDARSLRARRQELDAQMARLEQDEAAANHAEQEREHGVVASIAQEENLLGV